MTDCTDCPILKFDKMDKPYCGLEGYSCKEKNPSAIYSKIVSTNCEMISIDFKVKGKKYTYYPVEIEK